MVDEGIRRMEMVWVDEAVVGRVRMRCGGRARPRLTTRLNQSMARSLESWKRFDGERRTIDGQSLQRTIEMMA